MHRLIIASAIGIGLLAMAANHDFARGLSPTPTARRTPQQSLPRLTLSAFPPEIRCGADD